MIDEATIAEAGRRISAAAPAGARVILFGSHARSEADPQSDLDLLVIEPEVENAALESVRLHRTLRGLGVPADVVVVDEGLARRRAAVAGTMVERALREGRVLVDA
jgi:predicted nucleotidyltransferase